ncbi:hypothetical protein [Rubrolithibacter danxiaensis]|uniref:hypothetical protein n=1 Tax=Rubrolithibacter danxiaensis TaxID=3390805 RepID=UPI003BF89D9F
MEHTITEPATGMPFQFEAKPEKFNGEQGYRIICNNGSNFFISNKYGAWRSMDNHHVDAELLIRIGLAIEEAG